jgi:hypothetical protein
MSADTRVMRPLAEPLQLAAGELGDLVDLSERLQALLAQLMREAAPSTQRMVEAQAADLLSQRLAGVQTYLAALAEAAPIGAQIDVAPAVMGLLLGEQAQRLSLRSAAPIAADADDGGELLLFED